MQVATEEQKWETPFCVYLNVQMLNKRNIPDDTLAILSVIFSARLPSQLLRFKTEVMVGWTEDSVPFNTLGWRLFKWYIIGVVVVLYL